MTGRTRNRDQDIILASADAELMVAWWHTDDFWQYAMYAAVAFIRQAADRSGNGVPMLERLG